MIPFSSLSLRGGCCKLLLSIFTRTLSCCIWIHTCMQMCTPYSYTRWPTWHVLIYWIVSRTEQLSFIRKPKIRQRPAHGAGCFVSEKKKHAAESAEAAEEERKQSKLHGQKHSWGAGGGNGGSGGSGAGRARPQLLCVSAAVKISVMNQHLLDALANCSGLAPSTAYCSQNNCLLLFL